MTTQQIVSLFKARRAGRGKWIAHCTVHGRDRTPSLSIAEGRNGNTLMRCWAGCDPSVVLGTVGLTLKDLFADTKPDREAMELAEKHRAEAGRERMKMWRELRRTRDLRQYWEVQTKQLAKLLMDAPERGRLYAFFRDALQKARRFDKQEVELMCKLYKFKKEDLPWG